MWLCGSCSFSCWCLWGGVEIAPYGGQSATLLCGSGNVHWGLPLVSQSAHLLRISGNERFRVLREWVVLVFALTFIISGGFSFGGFLAFRVVLFSQIADLGHTEAG